MVETAFLLNFLADKAETSKLGAGLLFPMASLLLHHQQLLDYVPLPSLPAATFDADILVQMRCI